MAYLDDAVLVDAPYPELYRELASCPAGPCTQAIGVSHDLHGAVLQFIPSLATSQNTAAAGLEMHTDIATSLTGPYRHIVTCRLNK